MRPARLLLAAALLVGCNAAPITAPPSTPAPVVPSATAPASAAPTSGLTAQPIATCPATASPAELVLQTGPGFESISLDAEPLPTPEAIDATEVPIVVTVLGGIDHLGRVSLDEGPTDDVVITQASADFLPFGAAETKPVTATVSGTEVALVLPDAALAGQLRVSVSWTSRCGDGTGSGSIGLGVVKASVGAGCPAAGTGFDADLVALNDETFTVGTLDLPLIITGWMGRWVPGASAADVVQFSGWNRAQHVIAAPETTVVVSAAIDDLALRQMQVAMYRRDDVDAYLDADSTGTLDTYFFGRRNANAKGRASIPVPLETGSYVVEVTGSWLTSCLSLETYSAFSLEVR